MSEITTGAVPLSAIGAPLAVGEVCFKAAHFAAKYCSNQYDILLNEIEKTNERLKWINSHAVTSPTQIIQEATELQKMVSQTNAFMELTEGLAENDKQILSGVIAIQNSPLKSYVPQLLEEFPKSDLIFQQALHTGAKRLATDNFNYVGQIVKDAAAAVGFTNNIKVLKQTSNLLDIVFTDENDRRFTAYCKLDKEMNPSLALDLEGFACDQNSCSNKMDDIVRYLQEHGVPFHYQRLKHNQPQGVLRKLLNKKTMPVEENGVESYLQSNQNPLPNSQKN